MVENLMVKIMNLEIFKKFSEEARKVLIAAQKYSELTNTPISSDHLLMAIVVTPNSVAHKVLKQIPLTADQLRLVMTLAPSFRLTRENLSISQDLKNTIDQAAFIASEFNSDLIEVDHLMLGLLRNKNSRAYWLIAQAGVEPGLIQKNLETQLKPEASNGLTPMPHGIEIMGVMSEGINPALEIGPFSDFGMESEEDEPSAVKRFTTNLVETALKGDLDPVTGREEEIARIIHILGRKNKNNPVLVGEPGVGKTAIAEGLAAKIANGEVPHFLQTAKVYSLELSNLVAGTMYRGQFEERLKDLTDELNSAKNSILFIDEVHTLIGAGSAEGSLDAANILKPALAKGKIKLIGATTPEEFRKYIKKDAALSRRLQVVKVNEPTKEETLMILKGLRNHYQKFHGVKITDELLKNAVDLSAKYLNDRFFPDKAIDLIDEALARTRSEQKTPSHIIEAQKLKEKIKDLKNDKIRLVKDGFLKDAQVVRVNIANYEAQLKTLKKKAVKVGQIEPKPGILEAIIASWTGIPAKKLTGSERKHFARLEVALGKHILGQKQAINKIAWAIKRSKSGIMANQPIGSFLLVGPTGVGKTYTAKVIAREVFGSDKAITKLDMSEFSQPHQVARLIGAPPGYVGFQDGSIFGEKIRKNPHQVILFDEIEKAHPDIFNILLQIMDEGRLTDSYGEQIDLRHSLILLTSNIGSEFWSGRSDPGFNKTKKQISQGVSEKLKEYFRPEFLSRLSDTIVFEELDKKTLAKILDKEIEEFTKEIAVHNIQIKIPDNVKAALLKEIDNNSQGARGIKKLVNDKIINLCATQILNNPQKTKLEFVLKKDLVVVK